MQVDLMSFSRTNKSDNILSPSLDRGGKNRDMKEPAIVPEIQDEQFHEYIMNMSNADQKKMIIHLDKN